MLSELFPLFQNFWKAKIKVTTVSYWTEKISKQVNIQAVLLPIFSHSEKINNNKLEKQVEPTKKEGTKKV